jgi:L,D-transpeptidase ErfK/SrfK
MCRVLWLILLMMLTGMLSLLPAAAQGATLYHLVTGGEVEYVVEKPQSLTHLALTQGLRPWVLSRQTKIKVNTRLKPGTRLKFDTSHIVPTELSQGLVINLPELLLYQFYMGVYQRRYALAVGKRTWPTPTGTYSILDKRKNPTWNVPVSIQEEMWDQGKEVLEKVPPGPNNPLGKYFLGTSADGVGIHATNNPWSIGNFVSHGCIRMLPDEISQLFPQVEVGTLVKIIYQPVKVALTRDGRIFLEAHPNIYHRKIDYLDYVKKVAHSHQLEDRIDWRKVNTILKIKEGIAKDVTKEPLPTKSASASTYGARRGGLGLSPLQFRDTRIE